VGKNWKKGRGGTRVKGPWFCREKNLRIGGGAQKQFGGGKPRNWDYSVCVPCTGPPPVSVYRALSKQRGEGRRGVPLGFLPQRPEAKRVSTNARNLLRERKTGDKTLSWIMTGGGDRKTKWEKWRKWGLRVQTRVD